MFVQEAKLLHELIGSLQWSVNGSILDIGSSGKDYRCNIQPHIDEFVFRPLREAGCKIAYLDKKNVDGIDIVADLTDPMFDRNSQKTTFNLIICSNILEHVIDRELFMRNLFSFSHKGTFIIMTVPFRYFKHLDPIDTMFRPSPTELIQWISGLGKFEIQYSSFIVIDEKRYYKRRRKLARYIPIKISIDFWRYYLKSFRWKVSCIVFKIA
jgi:hypothetical protein